MRVPTVALLAVASLTAAAPAQTFVNWESPHVHPLALTPDGTRLLAVNTADNRLEVFAVSGTTLGHVASVPVGLDPVSVAARTDTEAWVVNHVSDTLSVVDLATMNVRATLRTGDEPTDVVFAAGKAFVSVSQLNEVRVFDPAALNAAPAVIPIAGEDPRALATDGTTVYAAIFESGNNTSILGEQTVTDPASNPYPGDPNPVPNDGLAFDPPIAGGLPTPPGVSHIIQRQPGGTWEDANGFDWSGAVTWDLHDHDVAMIDAGSLAVSYQSGIQNLNMGLAVRPGGNVVVIGTEALNHIRFEPNLNGTFLRVQAAEFAPGGGAATIVDLNPHLAYASPNVPQNVRDQSIGDPRGIAFNAAGDRAWISGMGSNNVILVDGALGRVGRVEVGEGPTGVVLNETAGVLYVLNKFEGSISVVDTTGLSELGRIGYFDPTPDVIRVLRSDAGRDPRRSTAPVRHARDLRARARLLRELPHRRAHGPACVGSRQPGRRGLAARPGAVQLRPRRLRNRVPPDEGADDHADARGHRRHRHPALARRPHRVRRLQPGVREPARRRRRAHRAADGRVRGVRRHAQDAAEPVPQPEQHARQRGPARHREPGHRREPLHDGAARLRGLRDVPRVPVRDERHAHERQPAPGDAEHQDPAAPQHV
jgi:YVTN family beta-propeller protein